MDLGLHKRASRPDDRVYTCRKQRVCVSHTRSVFVYKRRRNGQIPAESALLHYNHTGNNNHSLKAYVYERKSNDSKGRARKS